jgi:hypothetical protein
MINDVIIHVLVEDFPLVGGAEQDGELSLSCRIQDLFPREIRRDAVAIRRRLHAATLLWREDPTHGEGSSQALNRVLASFEGSA